MNTYLPWPVWFSATLAIVVSLAVPLHTSGTEAPGPATTATEKMLAAALLQQFARDWPDDRTTYRTEGDVSWTAYALTLRRLVAQGDTAIPALLAACNDPHVQVRALSARVLGFLAGNSAEIKSAGAKSREVQSDRARSVVARLIAMLDDSSPLVALMAADALGQIQDPRGLEALGEARQRIDHGDVLLHINKGLKRQVPLEADVCEQILRIRPDQLDAATVGQPAPDFTLRDPTGKAWRLADFRGRKSVVLVFIYGDG